MSRDSRMPEFPCPWCGKVLDGALDPLGDASPKPDDLTICIECEGIAVIQADLSLRRPKPGEVDPVLARTIARYQVLARLGRARSRANNN